MFKPDTLPELARRIGALVTSMRYPVVMDAQTTQKRELLNIRVIHYPDPGYPALRVRHFPRLI